MKRKGSEILQAGAYQKLTFQLKKTKAILGFIEVLEEQKKLEEKAFISHQESIAIVEEL